MAATVAEAARTLDAAPTDGDEIGAELSSCRTGMSLERTRMCADRTLMSVIRTALLLVSIGFVIHRGFTELREAGTFQGRTHAPQNLGVTLVGLGIVTLLIGIGYHAECMRELRRTREDLVEEGLVRGQSSFPPSMMLGTAVLLLCIGVAAIWSMLPR
jgi:putative membrane protein